MSRFGLPTLENVKASELACAHLFPSPQGCSRLLAALTGCSPRSLSAKRATGFFPEAVRAAEASPTACMFADCRHHEEPGCVVRTEPVWDRYWCEGGDVFPDVCLSFAPASGYLSASPLMNRGRQMSIVCRIYRELYDEVAEREAAESRQSGKLESNLRYKTKRGGKTQVEVKLEPKKHRRAAQTSGGLAPWTGLLASPVLERLLVLSQLSTDETNAKSHRRRVQRNNMKLEVVKLVEQDALDREDDEDDEGSDDPPSQELGPHRKW